MIAPHRWLAVLPRGIVRAVAAGAGAAALALAVGCGGAARDGGASRVTEPVPVPPAAPPAPPAPTDPPGPFVVGVPVTDPDGWVEYVPGDVPLLLIAPHGGTLTPAKLPLRNCAVIGGDCVTVNDAETQDLARRIADSVQARTGRRPHVLVNRLHRNRFDANRDAAVATGGLEALARPWRWFHAFADSARAAIAATHGRGLVIDVHGHGRPLARIEWGYLLSASQLDAGDAAVAGAVAATSVRRLAADSRAGDDVVALVRGAQSLGGLMQDRGWAGVPSPAQPSPMGEGYFNGGFNTARHGSRDGGVLDAIQMEAFGPGLRDTPEARGRFAGAFADALSAFLERQYGWRP